MRTSNRKFRNGSIKTVDFIPTEELHTLQNKARFWQATCCLVLACQFFVTSALMPDKQLTDQQRLSLLIQSTACDFNSAVGDSIHARKGSE